MGERAIRAIMGDTWAIRGEALDNILAIANREHEFAHGNFEALEQRLGRPLARTERVTVRDGVAVVPVTGPLFRYANLMTDLSGATSYATLATDLRTAVDDPAVSAIILQIDSPGGQVNGIAELTQQIRDIRGVKPIVAYVGGEAASAAYWIATAADEIVGTPTSTFGSVGAMIGITTSEATKPGEKRYRFVSSQSPLKNAGPDTPDGQREIQRLTDELAQVFIETVAANRGVAVGDVLEKYGQGAVYTGAEALKRGMIDSISTFEAVVSRFNNGRTAGLGGQPKGATFMTKQAGANTLPETMTAAWVAENYPAVADELRAEGVASVDTKKIAAEARAEGAQAERDRISGIEAIAANVAHIEAVQAIVADCKADADMTAEKAAVKILQAVGSAPKAPAASKGAQHLATLQQTETELDAPEAGNGSPAEPTLRDAAKAAVQQARAAAIDV